MKSIGRLCIGALLGFIAASGAAGAANLDDIVHETQQVVVDDQNMSVVWWFPLEFWAENIRANADIPADARSALIGTMADYTVVALLRARPAPGGLQDIQPREELAKNTRFEINGKSLESLPAERVSDSALALLAQLKPLLAEMAGEVGKALELAVYPARVDGKQVTDAGLPGRLVITFYNRNFVWHLPLGSLVPPKTDKKTGEQFPGNYDFNPFTGGKLDGK